jgi:hypothetical protein
MKLLDILAKLGILRFGAKAAVYKSATDRPAEFMMDGVANAERDLTTKEDLAKVAAALRGKPRKDDKVKATRP